MVEGTRINICFHGVGTPQRELEAGEADYWIDPGFLEQILDDVVGRPDVRLSFDDGNASDVEIGLPALRRRELTAEFFPVADRIGRPGSVDGAGLRTLVAEGMSIGSHGMRHVPWRGLSDADLDEELADARTVIAAESGTGISTAACPLGRYDRRVLMRLRRLGYRRVYTSDRARARPAAWLQPRHSVRRSDDLASVRRMLDRRPAVHEAVRDSLRMTVKRWL